MGEPFDKIVIQVLGATISDVIVFLVLGLPLTIGLAKSNKKHTHLKLKSRDVNMQPIISFEQFTFQYGHAVQPTLSDITFHIYGKSANCWTKWLRKVDISSLYKWANPIFFRRE